MEERFNEEFQIADAARIRQEIDRLHRKGGQGPLRMICSIQTLRRQELHELMENLLPSFDLTIVDEAHHMRNPGTIVRNWVTPRGRGLPPFTMVTKPNELQRRAFDLLSVPIPK